MKHRWMSASALAMACWWMFTLLLLFPNLSHAQENRDATEKQLDPVVTSTSLTNRRAKFPESIEKKTSDWGEDLAGLPEVTGKPFTAEGFSDGFVTSLSIILVSEVGDETFIIAALMAMRHPRAIVLSGALSALIIMTVLSTGLGRIVPNLISRKHTNAAATGFLHTLCQAARLALPVLSALQEGVVPVELPIVHSVQSHSQNLSMCRFLILDAQNVNQLSRVLYTFFGARLLYIAWRADSKSTPQKELEEVEEKLEGGVQKKGNVRRFLSRLLTPIFLEAFILTFLAEWGIAVKLQRLHWPLTSMPLE